MPFLNFKERSSLRASCTLLKKFIPAPNFVYTNTVTSFSEYQATARLEKNTGYVETRGYAAYGGDSSRVADHLQSNVIKIWSTNRSFAALKKNRKVISWESVFRHFLGDYILSPFSEFQTGVTQICGNTLAFAALKQGGKVVTWGNEVSGGDSWAVSSELQSGVTSVVATEYAFAALKSNGKVISWGKPHYGGDSSHLPSLNNGVIKLEGLYEVHKFRAIKNDGSIIQWPINFVLPHHYSA